MRRDKNLKNLLKEASHEGAMIDAQEYVFTTTFYDPIKQRAAKDGVTSALGITILCDTRINGHYLTAIEQTEDYFKGKQYTEREWLKYFLDRRQDLLAKGDPNLNRVSILRNLVDDKRIPIN